MPEPRHQERGSPAELASAAYVRERVTPRPGDQLYLHKLDVLAFVSRFAGELRGDVLDYGCGGSPYRGLFTGTTRYLRADLEGEVDYRLQPDLKLPLGDGSVDGVLSTQVLEHVEQPALYLAEAHRLLRPGGRLLLTTHGLFEEHGCPYDFHRWTAAGLASDLRRAGFHKVRTFKLTTNGRAAAGLLERLFIQLSDPRGGWRHKLLSAFRHGYRILLRAGINRWAEQLPGTAIAEGDAPDALYMAVGAIAEK